MSFWSKWSEKSFRRVDPIDHDSSPGTSKRSSSFFHKALTRSPFNKMSDPASAIFSEDRPTSPKFMSPITSQIKLPGIPSSPTTEYFSNGEKLFDVKDVFKPPKLPPIGQMSTQGLGSSTSKPNTGKAKVDWDGLVGYGRKALLPDEPEQPIFLDNMMSKYQQLLAPYASLIKRGEGIALALSEILNLTNEPVLIPISQWFEGRIPQPDQITQKSAMLSSSQITTLALYLARIGDIKSLQVLTNLPRIELDCVDDEGRSPLSYAAIGGHISALQLLEKYGASIDRVDSAGRSPLLLSSFFGQLNSVHYLLSSGADVFHRDYQGRTVLHYSVFSHDPKVTSLLLNSSLKMAVNVWKKQAPKTSALALVPDNYGLNCFLWATYLGQIEHVKVLLNHNKNLGKESDKDNMNCLHYCARNKHPLTAKYLIWYFEELLDQSTSTGQTPVHFAASEGNLLLLDLFVRRRRYLVDVRDSEDRTPLQYAAARGHVGCLSKLYKFFSNLDHQDSLGATALHYAALGGHIDCVHFLVKHGAALNLKDREGRDPCLWTVVKGDIEMIKFLATEGVNLTESVDKDKRNALHIASLMGNTSLCRFLIKSNMPINSKCNSGQTALVHAILGGRTDVVQILLENDADIDEKDHAGRTVLHWAIIRNAWEIFNLLLDADVIIDMPDNDGREPLHEACSVGNMMMIEKLLTLGCDPMMPDSLGRTPLHYVCGKGIALACSLLVSKGVAVNALDYGVHRQTPLDCALQGGHTDCIHILEDHYALTGHQIRELAAQAIQRAWKRHWIRKQTRNLPYVKGLTAVRDITRLKAAVRIQSWFRCRRQRVKYLKDLQLSKMIAVRNHEVMLTLQELDKAIAEREAAERERKLAEDDRKAAELDRAQAVQIRKKMVELRQQAAKEHKQTIQEQQLQMRQMQGKSSYDHKPLENKWTRSALRNTAASVIQKAWRRYGLNSQKIAVKKINFEDDGFSLDSNHKRDTQIHRPKSRPYLLGLEPPIVEVNSLNNSLAIAEPCEQSQPSVSKESLSAVVSKEIHTEPDSYFSIIKTPISRSAVHSSHSVRTNDSVEPPTPSRFSLAIGAGKQSQIVNPEQRSRRASYAAVEPQKLYRTVEAKVDTGRKPIKRVDSFKAVYSTTATSGHRRGSVSSETKWEGGSEIGKFGKIVLPPRNPHNNALPSPEILHHPQPSLDQLGKYSSSPLSRNLAATPPLAKDNIPDQSTKSYLNNRVSDILRHSSQSLAADVTASTNSVGGSTESIPKGYDDLNFHSMKRDVTRRGRKGSLRIT